MKIRKILLILMSFLLISCVWTPVDDTYKLKGKKNYKNFETLLEPVILPMSLSQDFTKGNEHESKNFGSLLIVYDWENNNIYDVVYTPHIGFYETFIPLKNSAGIVNHYYIDNGITIMSPSASELATRTFPDNLIYFQEVNNKYSHTKNIVLLYKKNITSEEKNVVSSITYGVKVLDKETGDVSDAQDLENNTEITKIVNTNDDTWILQKVDSESSVRSFILRKWNEETRSFGSEEYIYDENERFIEESLKYIDDNYIIWDTYQTNDGKNCLTIINRNDKSVKEIPYPNDYSKVNVYKLNNQLYAFYSDSTAIDSDEKEIRAEKLDVEKGLSELCHIYNSEYSDYHVFVRNNQLYFYKTMENTIFIWKFDSAEEKFKNVISIGINEVKTRLQD